MINLLVKYRFSFIAGTFAACGSFFGKLPSYIEFESGGPHFVYFNIGATFLRLLPFALMLACNILNWRFFLKALHSTEQTLTATVLSAASNYIVSFSLGTLVYKESTSYLTLIGSAFILSGLWFLCGADAGNENESIVKVRESKNK